jgi:predicted protein tyrosine phosphatase
MADKKQHRINVLFICSRNQWRSPTAEQIWKNSSRYAVRSRGLSKKAVRTLGSKDIAWSDVILVMEQDHRSRLVSRFGGELDARPVGVLDIPDDYEFMDPQLVDLLTERAGAYLDQLEEDA